MRFEQLKKMSNVVLKKRLYKSGKNWIVKSSLSFAGGLILFGATQVINVSADTVTPTETTEDSGSQQTNDTTKIDSNVNTNTMDDKPVDDQETEVNQNNSQAQNVQISNNQTVTKPAAQTSAQAPVQTTNQVQADSTGETTNTNDVYNLGTCQYYVDDNQVLHIGAGDFTQDQYDTLYNQVKSDQKEDGSIFRQVKSYNTITFDGKVTAHGSVANFFQGTTANSIKNLANFDTSDVTNFSSMFANSSTLQSLDLTGLNTSNATDFSNMFDDDKNIESLDVSGFKTGNVTNMQNMFHGVGSANTGVVDIKGLENWDTSNTTDMSFMFAELNFDPSGLKNFNTSKVTKMNSMFLSSKIIGKLDLSNFVGDSLNTMSQMFDSASQLTEINLSNLNTPNLIDKDNNNLAVWNEFENCSSLQKVDLSKFDGKNINNYGNMFYKCPKLTTIIWPDVSTDSATSFDSMFSGDMSLTENDLNFLSKFNTSKVKDFNSMFSTCVSITKLPEVESWDMTSANNLGSMFQGDTSLTNLDLSKWTINNAQFLDEFLSGCTNLINLKLPKFDNPVYPTLNMSYMLSQCGKLNLLDFSTFVVPQNANKMSMFYGADHLFKLILNNKVDLDGTSLSYYNIYKGWNNVGNGSDDDPESNLGLHDGDEMMSTYTNGSGPDETWVIAERKTINYQIKYVDYDTKKDINSSYDINTSGREGWTVVIPTLFTSQGTNVPGYDGSENYDLDDDGLMSRQILPEYGTPAADNLVYTVRVKSVPPFVIKISDVPDTISLTVNDPNAIKDNRTLQNLNNTKQLDPDKTMISLMGQDVSETRFYLMLELASPAKTVKSLVGDIIKYLGREDDKQEVLTPLNIEIIVAYKPDTGNPSHSGGTAINRVVQDINQTSATFSDRPAVHLYDYDGNIISDRLLGVNTDWKNDQEMVLNGQTYYRVSTDEWVKAYDVYVYVEHPSKIRTYKESNVQLKNAHLDNARILMPSTDWKTDRYAIFDGQTYYRVSTNEFVPIDKVYEYQDSSNIIHSKRATPIFDERGNRLSQTLNPDMDYKTDKIVQINNEPYYRVSTNGFVKKSDIN